MSFQHKTNWPDVQRFLPNPSIGYPPKTFGCWFLAKAWKVEILLGNVLVEREVRHKGKVSVLRQEEASSSFLHICVYAYLCKNKKKKTKRWTWKNSELYVLISLSSGETTWRRPKCFKTKGRDHSDCSEEHETELWVSVNGMIPTMNFIGLYIVRFPLCLKHGVIFVTWLYGPWMSPIRDASIYLRVILFSNSLAYLY